VDPTTRVYLEQPDFVQMLREVQRNPSSLNNYLSDQRMVQVLTLMLSIKLQNQSNGAPEPAAAQSNLPPPKQQPEAKAREPEPEPEPMEVTEEEKEQKERKVSAQKEKEAGNAAYKVKDFEFLIPRSSTTQRPWSSMMRTSPTWLHYQSCCCLS
jgi:stress-induced-phosphoprotein 1